MKSIFISLLFSFSLISGICQSIPLKQKDLKRLASCMAGEFNNNEQADTDKSYYHVVLRIKPIWKERSDGYWFYVEQAVISSEHLPFRQRINHLYQLDDTTIVCRVYELKDPKQFTGAWKDEGAFGKIALDSLIDRQGCTSYFHKTRKHVFTGSTSGKECLSSLRGAAYTTSEMTVSRNRLVSWDRGWNGEDQQIWGAGKGGYIFIKQKDL